MFQAPLESDLYSLDAYFRREEMGRRWENACFSSKIVPTSIIIRVEIINCSHSSAERERYIAVENEITAINVVPGSVLSLKRNPDGIWQYVANCPSSFSYIYITQPHI